MRGLLEKWGFSGEKSELYRAKTKLKKVSINEVLNNITKSCWNYNIQYEIILKNSDKLIIKLIGREKKLLLKYHKKDSIMMRDYEEFLNWLEHCKIERGIYIATGFFEKKIYSDECNLFHNKVKKIDVEKFIKKQMNIDRLSFLEYLP
ncbi:hypothetical protein HBE96_11245 [Clostridium sp. P21]|uniref:Restriction endonuclease type IV Mrr domain-containing protein n=1 Tax=Clostridium muellerianum TaxID=2716538 RepID=A0A7Y0HQ09_9CLOT|nr:hypothetical protein [Clostridium muellerianum]NMM63243.1 hypothetical protein [Clostridium muellerianum]